MPTPIPNRGSDYELLLPPPVIHAVKFARHFFLFFFLPIAAVVIAALLAATLVISVRRSLFARIATPEEVLEDALRRLRRNDNDVPTIGYQHGPSSAAAARHRRHREAALEALRVVIRRRPEIARAYVVLGTELLYSHVNDGVARWGGGGGMNGSPRCEGTGTTN